ncbi:hypothetical protein KKC32_00400 [Patescibacteria group bacterium]|nr:hypothetical protein [Patescibacteria group bacterium]
MKKFLLFLSLIAVVFTIGSVLLINRAFAWTEPSGVPPENNVSAPINVSRMPQIKSGALGLNGGDPAAQFGLFVRSGKIGASKSINESTLAEVEENNSSSGISVKADKAGYHGLHSEVKGAWSVGGYFSNNDFSGPAIQAMALDTGAVVSGDNIGISAVSQKTGLIAKTENTDVYLSHNSDYSEKTKKRTFGVLSEITEAGQSNPAILPIAIGAYYDANNFAEAGLEGTGIRAMGSEFAGYFVGNVKIRGELTVSSCSGCTADLAEALAKRESVEAGDIVAIDAEMNLYKAEKNDRTVAGVISTNPFLTFNREKNSAPLALSGIVPVKVNNENGEISAGDFIAASSTAGYGMKAVEPATVVGKALEGFSGKQGKIKILVSTSWFAGANCQK